MVQGASPERERGKGRNREIKRKRRRVREREREKASENYPEKKELDEGDREIPGVRGGRVLLLDNLET